MYYTIRQMAELFGVTEHTLRFYTDKGLLPCTRDGGNRRVFDEESVNWMQGIQCLKGCGASLEDIQAYCRLCLAEGSEENLRARYANDLYSYYEGQGVASGKLYHCRKERAGQVYDKEILMAVSRNLGHSRCDVVVSHYLYMR